MSIFEEVQGFNNINLGPTIQQFQILNVQLQNATNNSQKLESATKSLDSKGMAALSGTIGNVQNLFQSLGVELDSVTNRILSVATATTGLIGSMQSLNERKVTPIIKDTFSKGWTDAAKQTENFDDAMAAFREQRIEMLTDVGSQWVKLGNWYFIFLTTLPSQILNHLYDRNRSPIKHNLFLQR